jgi:acetyltransferase-like isoleucine patch superfamily enzyme
MGRHVFVSDSSHRYTDTSVPIIQQGLIVRPTSIGDGSWLGNHSVVIGCSIGKNCVVSANAVVTRDVPDYCVVGGVPARVLKRYDPEGGDWTRGTSEHPEASAQ